MLKGINLAEKTNINLGTQNSIYTRHALIRINSKGWSYWFFDTLKQIKRYKLSFKQQEITQNRERKQFLWYGFHFRTWKLPHWVLSLEKNTRKTLGICCKLYFMWWSMSKWFAKRAKNKVLRAKEQKLVSENKISSPQSALSAETLAWAFFICMLLS